MFDKILLDGPCSGLGQRPLLSFNLTGASFCSYQPLQRKLLSQAVALLKGGGTLVYSTCTLTPEENEVQVKWLLDTHPAMMLVGQACPATCVIIVSTVFIIVGATQLWLPWTGRLWSR